MGVDKSTQLTLTRLTRPAIPQEGGSQVDWPTTGKPELMAREGFGLDPRWLPDFGGLLVERWRCVNIVVVQR